MNLCWDGGKWVWVTGRLYAGCIVKGRDPSRGPVALSGVTLVTQSTLATNSEALDSKTCSQ